MDAQAFGARLRELREGAGLTQQQLAEAIGSTVRNISRLETGAQEATWPTVLKLCQALGVECTAFTQPPADPEPSGRGRPRKAEGKAEGKAAADTAGKRAGQQPTRGADMAKKGQRRGKKA